MTGAQAYIASPLTDDRVNINSKVVDEKDVNINRTFNQDNYLSEFLLSGASEDMAVDGSISAVEFSFMVPAARKVKLSRGFITIEDGNTEFTPSNFGQLTALSNGVEISITPSGGAKVILETWITNREMRNTMFDFDNEFKQAGAYIGRWSFGKDLGNSGYSLAAGDKFSFLIQDLLTGLDFMSFRLKGNIEDI